jgi:hypothetical protein
MADGQTASAGRRGPGDRSVVFLLLKTAVDVAMHVIGHAMARAAARRARGRLS